MSHGMRHDRSHTVAHNSATYYGPYYARRHIERHNANIFPSMQRNMAGSWRREGLRSCECGSTRKPREFNQTGLIPSGMNLEIPGNSA
jgi:hypothetical protein